MKNIIICLILTLAIGCSKKKDDIPLPASKTKGLITNQALYILGKERNYHLFVPDNPTNASIVLLFHGNGGSFDDLLGFTGVKAPYKIWLNIAQQENLIILVPNGTLGSNNSRGWNDCRLDNLTNPNVDDVLFINNLLDFITNKYQANALKVYCVGTSNGGHFCYRLTQELPDKITAFAAIAASNPAINQCSSSTVKISALIMNGTNDPILPFSGGAMASNRGQVVSTDSTINYWINRNQTTSTPVITNLPNINATDNCTITKFLYQNGGNNTEVALFKVINGGHTEPSIAERYSSFFLLAVGKQNGDIEMANEIWSFLKNKSK